LRHRVGDLAEPGFAGLGLLLFQHLLRDVFHGVDDEYDVARRIQHRRIERFPVSDFEFAVDRAVLRYIVFLDRHRVGPPVLQHAHQRGAQVRDAGRAGIRGIIGKDLEKISSQNLFARRHGGVQARFIRGDHREVGRQNQIRNRCCIE
jgi:hypothetical protein